MAQKDIIFRLKVEGSGNTQQLLSQTTKEVDKLEKELKQAEQGTDKFLQAQRRLAQFQSTLKNRGSEFSGQLSRVNKLQGQATKKTNAATKSVSGLSGSFNIATKAAAALIALQLAQKVAELGKSAILAAGEYENLSVAFDTFLGGADKATQVLADLNKFSVETPFTPDQINKAAKQLLAFNFTVGETQKLLRITGNISAGTGSNFNELIEIIGKARVQGRLYQEDINQFSGRGVNIVAEIAKQFGKTEGEVRKLVETGRVGYPQLEKALTSLATEGGKFSGLIEKQAKTLPGLISTLEGAWGNFLRVLGEGAALESAKSGISSIIDLIGGVSDALDPQAKLTQKSVDELKKSLSLGGLGALTKTELAARTTIIEAALLEEQRVLEINADAQKIFADKAKSEATRGVKERLTGVYESFDRVFGDALEEDSRATSLAQAEIRANIERTQRARVASLQIALDDIKKINDNATKAQRAERAKESTDLLKLQIFRLELAKKFAEERQKLAIKNATIDLQAIDEIEAAEIKLSNLRLQLANKNAKTQAQRTLNSEKEADKLATGLKKQEGLIDDSLQAATEALDGRIQTSIGEIVNQDLAAEFDAWVKSGSLVPLTFEVIDDAAVNLASNLDTVIDGVKFTLEELAPLAFDVFGQVLQAQEAALDRAIDIQKQRVEDAQKIADEGNAEALKQERTRLAALQDARAEAARKQAILANAQIKLQIGLAVANAAAQTIGLTPLASLAAGAAVAFGLPAIINSIPSFGDGGEIGGNSHANGGVMINAEGGEFVTNKVSSKSFMPALKAMNQKKASPELVNAAATGNISQIFDLHTKPITGRLESLERAIKGIPQTDLIINEQGFNRRVSKFHSLAGRIVK